MPVLSYDVLTTSRFAPPSSGCVRIFLTWSMDRIDWAVYLEVVSVECGANGMDESTSSHNPHLYWRQSVAFLMDDVDGGYGCSMNLYWNSKGALKM